MICHHQKVKKTCNNISIIDYFLLSSPVFSLIKFFDVLDLKPLFSDVHCGLCFSLYASVNKFTTHSFDNCSKSSAQAKQVHNKENLFIKTVSSDVERFDELQSLLYNMNQQCQGDSTKTCINEVIGKICDLLKCTAKRVFATKNRNPP
jgi:hypothetical protein